MRCFGATAVRIYSDIKNGKTEERCGAFPLCLKTGTKLLFSQAGRKKGRNFKNKQKDEGVMIPPVPSRLRQRTGPSGDARHSLIPNPPGPHHLKKAVSDFTLRLELPRSPRGKAPAPGRLVFPQICRPSRRRGSRKRRRREREREREEKKITPK